MVRRRRGGERTASWGTLGLDWRRVEEHVSFLTDFLYPKKRGKEHNILKFIVILRFLKNR
jgi:hypothetical protein